MIKKTFPQRRALIVESDAHNLVVIVSILSPLGIAYKRNTTGARVLQQAHSMQPDLDFILLDQDLPDDNPTRICWALKSDPALRQVPIIVMGKPDFPLPQSLQNWCAAYITKPLSQKNLTTILDQLLQPDH